MPPRCSSLPTWAPGATSRTRRVRADRPMVIRSGPSPSSAPIHAVSAPQDTLGETPLWCERSNTLFWLDIDGKKLQRLHPASGQLDVWSFDCRYAGSLALTTDTDTVLIDLDL